MKYGHPLRDAADHRRAHTVPLQERRHHPLLGQTAHPDRVLHGLAIAVDTHVAVAADDRNDAEVGVRAETPVEPHLLLTEVTAQRQRAEIEEAHVQRLLHLVDEVAGEEEERNMRLD